MKIVKVFGSWWDYEFFKHSSHQKKGQIYLWGLKFIYLLFFKEIEMLIISLMIVFFNKTYKRKNRFLGFECCCWIICSCLQDEFSKQLTGDDISGCHSNKEKGVKIDLFCLIWLKWKARISLIDRCYLQGTKVLMPWANICNVTFKHHTNKYNLSSKIYYRDQPQSWNCDVFFHNIVSNILIKYK